jgi:hypothetical protein
MGTHSLESADGGTSQNGEKTEQVTGTHVLESADRGIGQSGKGNGGSNGHSHPGEHRGRDKSEWEKEPSERRALTSWRMQREDQVRMGKETEQATSTHVLERADGGTNQSGKRN